jgi:Tol biopolymer transport system component
VADDAGQCDPELLLACPTTFCSSPSWSHDGELLLFSQRNASEFGAAAVSPPRLYIMHVASGETAPVFADSQKLGFEARWSSDNQWITYLSPDFVGVGVYNLETGAERFYPTQTGEAAVWQPGATRFVMNEQRMIGERSAIHLILVDPISDTRVNLSGEAALVEDGAAVWSPDGEWIAFRRNITDGPDATLTKQLWLMRSDGSQARPLTNDPAIDHGPPVWSPDGKTLLFHKFPLKGPDIVISVWLMDVASGEQRADRDAGAAPAVAAVRSGSGLLHLVAIEHLHRFFTHRHRVDAVAAEEGDEVGREIERGKDRDDGQVAIFGESSAQTRRCAENPETPVHPRRGAMTWSR